MCREVYREVVVEGSKRYEQAKDGIAGRASEIHQHGPRSGAYFISGNVGQHSIITSFITKHNFPCVRKSLCQHLCEGRCYLSSDIVSHVLRCFSTLATSSIKMIARVVGLAKGLLEINPMHAKGRSPVAYLDAFLVHLDGTGKVLVVFGHN